MALSKADPRDIADDAGLMNPQKQKYVKFMKDRFPNESDPAYAREWADRIRRGSAFDVADKKSFNALKRAGFEEIEGMLGGTQIQ